jgi:hypothetical protein
LSSIGRKATITLVRGRFRTVTVQAPKDPIGWMEDIGGSAAAEEKQHGNYQKPSHLMDSEHQPECNSPCQSAGASWSRRDKRGVSRENLTPQSKVWA